MAPCVVLRKFHLKKSHIPMATSWLLVVSLLASVCGGQREDLSYSILEELPVGTLVANISADSGMTSAAGSDVALTYRLAQQPSSASRYFSLDSQSGQLRTAVQLDREEVCPFVRTCELEAGVVVRSTDGQFFRTVMVKVTLDDVNDNAPTFPSPSVSLTIPESVSVPKSFRISAATDRDQGLLNGVQSYDILVGNETFGLSTEKNLDGSETLSLVVRSLLDRELREYYSVVIAARDGGSPPRTGYLEIAVTISDVNDNPPVFPVGEYNVNVNESAPVNSSVAMVTASDDDVGENGRVTYRLSARSTSDVTSFFAVSPESGEIRTVALLRSRQGETIRIVVEGIDNGENPLVAQVLVQVHVLDSINNPPEIRVAFLAGGDTTAVVPENATQGFVVAHYLVDDADTGRNGEVSCSMTAESLELQQLKAREFKIVVRRLLDRERQAQLDVIMTCRDRGSPPLSTSQPLSVLVADVNDNDPVFELTSYSVNVSEGVTVGTVLLRVTANDSDAGDNGKVTYEIVPPTEASKYVVIHPVFGDITVASELDREAVASLSFSVAALDMGTPRRRAVTVVTLNITDVNDNAPVFEEPLVFSILENTDVNTMMARVQASDVDEGVNSEVHFELKESSLFFNLSREGVLSTLVRFDRETREKYQLDVMVSDGGSPSLTSSTAVVVLIDDVNDNAPTFTFPARDNDTTILGAPCSPMTSVVNVTAQDADDVANGVRLFALEGEEDLFSLNVTSGEILTAREVALSDIGRYELRLRVQDGGSPSLTSTATLHVEIARSNATASAANSPGANVLVVGMLVGLTLLVATCVVVIIVFIRRTDRRRASAKAPSASASNTYAAAAHIDVPRKVKVNGVYDVAPSRSSVCDDVSKGDLSSMHVTFMDLAQRDRNSGPNGGSQHDASADDMLSHASGETTTTTDSGRGASESESNGRSHRACAPALSTDACPAAGTEDFRFTVREFRKFPLQEKPSPSREELSSLEYRQGIARAALSTTLGRPLLLGGDSDHQRRPPDLEDDVSGRLRQSDASPSVSRHPRMQGRDNCGFETDLDDVMELPVASPGSRDKKRRPIQYCGDLLTRGYSFEGSTSSGPDTPGLAPAHVAIDLSSSYPSAKFRPGVSDEKNFRAKSRFPAKSSNFRTHSRPPPHPGLSASARKNASPPVRPPRSKVSDGVHPLHSPPAYPERSKSAAEERRPPFCSEPHSDALSQGDGGEDDRSSSTSGSYTIDPVDSVSFQVTHVYV